MCHVDLKDPRNTWDKKDYVVQHQVLYVSLSM